MLAMGSRLVLVIGIAMLTSIIPGLLNGDSTHAIAGFVICSVTCMAFSICGLLFTRGAGKDKQHDLRDGFASVLFAWFAAIIFGALPFCIISDFTFADAIFETASGYSTTGASIIDKEMILRAGGKLVGGLESLPSSILYWRSLLHWIGGIGFVMFVLMILPILGGGKQLYNAEVPGLRSSTEQLTPRIASTSRLLIACYVLLTVVTGGTYWLLGMDAFDAVCHSFATVATGGFSTHSESFAYFQKPALQWAAVLFMLCSACNFTLTLKVIVHRKIEHFKNEEFNFFILLAIICTVCFAIMLRIRNNVPLPSTGGYDIGNSWEALFRTSAFQVASLMSTTGFATSDFTLWNLNGLPGIVLFLMFCGGCAGSTGGGFKCARIIVLLKQTIGELRRQIFPHLLEDVRISGKRLEHSVVNQTMAFTVLYLATLAFCTLVLPFLSPMDFETALSTSISAISNVGPGLSQVAPRFSYAWMSSPAKLLLAFIMIAGRLELYTVFVSLLPRFWNTDGKALRLPFHFGSISCGHSGHKRP